MFKILENIFKAKNDDIGDMIRYLIEDTPLVPFLINHGPKILPQIEEAKINDEDK